MSIHLHDVKVPAFGKIEAFLDPRRAVRTAELMGVDDDGFGFPFQLRDGPGLKRAGGHERADQRNTAGDSGLFEKSSAAETRIGH